MMAHLLLHQN